MKIRLADTTEVSVRNKLLGLQVTCLPHDDPADVHKGRWWVVYEGAAMVAFAALYLWHQGDQAIAHLKRSGVLPEFQGRGIQKKLIRARIEFAKTNYVTTVVTDTYNNPASANSLIACGFRTYMPDDLWCADGAVYWKKEIQCLPPTPTELPTPTPA